MRTPAEADRIARGAETTALTASDPELLYYLGTLFAYCGKQQAALRLLQPAIDQQYCAYSNLQMDPLLSKLRTAPGFDKLLNAAKECQKPFIGVSRTESMLRVRPNIPIYEQAKAEYAKLQ
jgi:hypothetical protein